MSSISPGTHFGRFRVVRLLAQGGMAEVYRAEQELAEGIWRPAALKVIRPEYSESEDFREMFLDEARTACTLAHPNIVHIYEVGEAEGRLYMGMELVAGESLSNVARVLRGRSERFSDESLLAIGIFTCAALEAVHALKLSGQGHLNLVHRDVSPHNLLLAATGSLKLIDFGIAKASTNRNLTNAGVTKGKAGYFSPEQAMGKSLDGRSDLFSLGVTLYKLAAGHTPFDEHKSHQDRNTALVHGKWEPLKAVCKGLPPGLYEVVERALEVHRDDRYATAREMREALESVAFDSGVQVSQSSLIGYVEENDDEISISTVSPLRPQPRRTQQNVRRISLETDRLPKSAKRRKWALGGAGAALVLVIALGAAMITSNTPQPDPLVAVDPFTDPELDPNRGSASQVATGDAPPKGDGSGTAPDGTIAGGTAAVVPDTPPVDSPPEEKKRAVNPVRVVSNKPTTPPDAPTVTAPPTGGFGKLRMNDPPDFQVTIAGKLAQSPFSVDLPSGLHKAIIARPDGSEETRCEIAIYPDRPTRLRYDVTSKRCSVN